MEDFPILLLFLIIYLIAASSSKKGKKKKKRLPMRSAREGERADVHQMKRNRETAAGFDAAFEHTQNTKYAEARDDCDKKPLHWHEVTPIQMCMAAEGEDPCHAGGHTMQEEPEERMDDYADMLRQDVLHGVIMSEILVRPHERKSMQRNRQGYHG